MFCSVFAEEATTAAKCTGHAKYARAADGPTRGPDGPAWTDAKPADEPADRST